MDFVSFSFKIDKIVVIDIVIPLSDLTGRQ